MLIVWEVLSHLGSKVLVVFKDDNTEAYVSDMFFFRVGIVQQQESNVGVQIRYV